VDSIYRKYSEKFASSKSAYERACKLFPKGVCHDIRNYPPFPVVTERCDDIYMYDIDGGRILDLWMGHFALMLGHGNSPQKKGIEKGVAAGIHHGTLNCMQIEFAELIKKAVPEMELMRFCSSGTEATMYVTRVARAFTKRAVIVKAEGGWHGGNSVLSNNVAPPFEKKKNQPEGDQTISIPYNDTQRTYDILTGYEGSVAAIIIEPMLGAGGGICASPEYLKMLREYCSRTGTILIFDEVVTGFRFRYGSVYPLLGTAPDLFTFGKATAGGMHIGMYGGQKDIMQIIETEKLFVGGGTYSANPLSMAVGIETLQALAAMDYTALNKAGDSIRNFLSDLSSKIKTPAVATGFGSYFCLHFLTQKPQAVTPHTLMTTSDRKKEEVFKAAMLVNDVFTMHAGGALSFRHTADVTIDTIKRAYILSLEEMGLL
jgi:glutamate-1-semialdehyde 2,1-aminomutase